ncbi:helix-turn-helix domain-containing protein [Thermococcus argininiproducens]|uniref:Helix-turn-helix domain-containing protein n=1 Tax=Thermococcus argininiproducens TaxID=2866384 RepID=A0A9E7MAH8_9EURY|nr:helix-turn-helix domain-containing protein [Thermococcus argininiproducens]USG99691.1 helix-turn-helix domain-containing protein [Thermococcus argininiproducens]
MEKSEISVEKEILKILREKGELTVAFITRFLNESGIECTRQKVEKTLEKLSRAGIVEFFYRNGNHRRHYRLVVQ